MWVFLPAIAIWVTILVGMVILYFRSHWTKNLNNTELSFGLYQTNMFSYIMARWFVDWSISVAKHCFICKGMLFNVQHCHPLQSIFCTWPYNSLHKATINCSSFKWEEKVLVIVQSSVLFVFSPAYSRTSQPVLCEWRWLVGVYMCAPGLKTWPGFKDIHQRTDASGFRVCCYTDSYSFTPFHSTVVYFKMDWAAGFFFFYP